jgi:hypothetical protein
MSTLLAAGVLLFATTSTGLADAQNEFKTAGGFVDAYRRKNDNIYMRLYIRGIGDGVGAYNASLAETDGDRRVYCLPQTVGLNDAQYVAIMSSFLTKYPKEITTRLGGVAVCAGQLPPVGGHDDGSP